MKKINFLVFFAAFSIFTFAGGAKDGVQDQDKLPKVVATIFPAYDFARAIMFGPPEGEGGKTKLSSPSQSLTFLVKPGMEVHSFDPSPADIIAIQNSDVFIYIGGESDEWVNKILGSIDRNKVHVLKLTDYVELTAPKTEFYHDEHEGHDHDAQCCEHETDGSDDHAGHNHEIDEHIWTAPANAVKLVKAIEKALLYADFIKSGAKNQKLFASNAAEYCRQIDTVSADIKQLVDNSSEKFFIMGDRFPLVYFAQQFGLEYAAAFEGCSSAVEASTASIARLIDAAKDKKVPVIFSIELSNQKIAKTIAEGVSKTSPLPVLELHSVHNLSKRDFDAGETWVSLMKRNVKNLKAGLR